MSDNVTTLKNKAQTATDEVRAEITAVAATATEADRKLVDDLIAMAKRGKFDAEVFTITPPAAAILFLNHNRHNRDWRADGVKSCREYARRMSAGQWKQNNAAIGFYVDATLEDGQHRLSGGAVARYTLTTAVVMGIHRDAVVTVDDGLVRHGADHAKLLGGTVDAPRKEIIINIYSRYMVKCGHTELTLRSPAEVHDAIQRHDPTLTEAIEIGANSIINISEPVLKPQQAQSLAFLMLQNGWDRHRVREKLALFQTGVSPDSEKSPYFVGADIIRSARKKSDTRDRLSGLKELGVALYAMQIAESGVKAISASAMRNAVKKALPNPAYPGEPGEQQAAE